MTTRHPRRAEVRYGQPAGVCRWCEKPIDRNAHPRRTHWHPECVEAWKETQPAHQRWLLQRRDHGVCACCGVRTDDLVERLRGMAYWRWLARLDYVPARHALRWERDRNVTTLEAIRNALTVECDLPMREFASGKRTPWDADHVVELADGGENNLANLQTLCVPCHKEKTARSARQRAARRREERSGQMSIEAA